LFATLALMLAPVLTRAAFPFTSIKPGKMQLVGLDAYVDRMGAIVVDHWQMPDQPGVRRPIANR
jgi:hypothetical protein